MVSKKKLKRLLDNALFMRGVAEAGEQRAMRELREYKEELVKAGVLEYD